MYANNNGDIGSSDQMSVYYTSIFEGVFQAHFGYTINIAGAIIINSADLPLTTTFWQSMSVVVANEDMADLVPPNDPFWTRMYNAIVLNCLRMQNLTS